MKELVLTRVPPGDRWQDSNGESDIVFKSLTEGLQYVFEKSGNKESHLSAFEGKIFVVIPDKPKAPEPPQKYTMYGEEL